MPASPSYKYYIKPSSTSSYPTSSQTSNTFTGLEQNTSYDIKVEVADVAGNVGAGEVTGVKTQVRIVDWTQNPDGTITNGETTVKIGDYVDYNCKTNMTYTSPASKSGHTGDQTFRTNEYNYGWRVLGVDSSKRLLLISEDFVTAYYNLVGKAGYVNGVSELNNICSIYGKGQGAVSARTVNVEDINRITGYNPNNTGVKDPNQTGSGLKYATNEQWEYGKDMEYRINDGKVEYKPSSASNWIKSSYTSLEYYNETSKIWKNLTTNGNVTLKGSMYEYYPTTLNETDNINATVGIKSTSPEYKMLFTNSSTGSNIENSGNTTNFDYFLGSTCIRQTIGWANFSMRCVSNGKIYYAPLYYSNGSSNSSRLLKIRPVVTLKSDIQLRDSNATKDGCKLYNMTVNN